MGAALFSLLLGPRWLLWVFALLVLQIGHCPCHGNPCASTKSGTVDLGNGRKMFYWHLQSSGSSNKAVVLWLGRKLGCSAVASAVDFFPCVHRGASAASWGDVADVLAVDAPGVGMSVLYGGKSQKGCSGIGEDVLTFMKGWLVAHPTYTQHRIFVFGEGETGHCIPVIAHTVAKSLPQFAGIGMGNSIFNAGTHVKSYPAFLKHAGLPASLLSHHAVVNCAIKIGNCNKVSQNQESVR
jgi:carboxypeptidase C (cathepsin A)